MFEMNVDLEISQKLSKVFLDLAPWFVLVNSSIYKCNGTVSTKHLLMSLFFISVIRQTISLVM